MKKTCEPLSPAAIRTRLQSEIRELRLECYEQAPSTNDIAHRYILQSEPDAFLAVLAEEQAGGRGRRGRTWHSPPGAGLLMSTAMSFASPAAVRFEEWPLLAALAVREAIADFVAAPVQIKWPNDVLMDGKKVCGILTELGNHSHGRCLIIGFGVNVSADPADFPEDLRSRATSILSASGQLCDRNQLAAAILNHMQRVRMDCRNGKRFADRHDEWTIHCNTPGHYVRVQQGKDWFEGVAEQIDERGTLHMVTGDGKRREIVSGEIVESCPGPHFPMKGTDNT
ncbi:MAG: biotin--[acetyl-CoA-carboxylase] ligase [Bacilli bacterium]